jgi:hypothetical protein
MRIEEIDWSVGQILNTLREEGLPPDEREQAVLDELESIIKVQQTALDKLRSDLKDRDKSSDSL